MRSSQFRKFLGPVLKHRVARLFSVVHMTHTNKPQPPTIKVKIQRVLSRHLSSGAGLTWVILVSQVPLALQITDHRSTSLPAVPRQGSRWVGNNNECMPLHATGGAKAPRGTSRVSLVQMYPPYPSSHSPSPDDDSCCDPGNFNNPFPLLWYHFYSHLFSSCLGTVPVEEWQLSWLMAVSGLNHFYKYMPGRKEDREQRKGRSKSHLFGQECCR